jgi:hypothetical protein
MVEKSSISYMYEPSSTVSNPHVVSTTQYGVTVTGELGNGRYKKKTIKYICPCCGKSIKITIEEDEV